jgi:cell division protein FtsA
VENLIPSGVVITGGSALLDGITDVAESVFHLPVRLGQPRGISGLVDVVNNPMYATGVGLLLYGAKNHNPQKFRIRDSNIFSRLVAKDEKMVQGNYLIGEDKMNQRDAKKNWRRDNYDN